MLNIKQLIKTAFLSPLGMIKIKLEKLEITETQTAKKIVSLIPNQCPFAREIRLFNFYVGKIPPLCKLNPLYDDLMILRFRALSFLCDMGEDITPYCQ